MNTSVFDTDYWRTRAEDARTIAAQLLDPVSQKAMWTIAKSYDSLAEGAGARGKNKAWSADIFDRGTSRLMHMVSFSSYEELQGWLTGLIADRPDLDFEASFALPADAPESHRQALATLNRVVQRR